MDRTGFNQALGFRDRWREVNGGEQLCQPDRQGNRYVFRLDVFRRLTFSENPVEFFASELGSGGTMVIRDDSDGEISFCIHRMTMTRSNIGAEFLQVGERNVG